MCGGSEPGREGRRRDTESHPSPPPPGGACCMRTAPSRTPEPDGFVSLPAVSYFGTEGTRGPLLVRGRAQPEGRQFVSTTCNKGSRGLAVATLLLSPLACLVHRSSAYVQYVLSLGCRVLSKPASEPQRGLWVGEHGKQGHTLRERIGTAR